MHQIDVCEKLIRDFSTNKLKIKQRNTVYYMWEISANLQNTLEYYS